MSPAQILLAHWRDGTRLSALPDPPQSREDGYAIAAELAKLQGSPQAGWKIAATSEAGQKHINVPGPLAARIFQDRVLKPGASVPIANNIMRVAEGEFAFKFGKNLPPRAKDYSIDEVKDAVSSLHLSLEVPDSRYIDFTKVGAAQLIADTACADWLVLGPAVEVPWRNVDLAEHRLSGFVNGKKVNEGSGKAALGGPWVALTWLVNEASRYCGGVKAGQFVTTGTCIVPLAITEGDEVLIDYGAFGTIGARMVT